MSTKVYLEYNAVENHQEELVCRGNKALIVTGKSSAVNGSLKDTIDILEKHGRSYAIFDEIKENPDVESVMKAAELGRKENVDFVIGIGGGSPLDASKAISIMIKNLDKDWPFLYETGEVQALPVICIPTTCGTGSEVTAVSVLTRHDLMTKVTMKRKLFPEIALIDPSYLFTAGADIIRNTSIDAMSHMIESYINNSTTEESRSIAVAGLKSWGMIKDQIEDISNVSTSEKETVYKNLMESADMGGLAIVGPGTSMCHGLSYKFTYNYHVPHGMAVGMFQSAFLRLAGKEYSSVLLDAMGFDGLEAFTDYINNNCFKPLFEKYMSKEEFKKQLLASLDAFWQDSARVGKLTFKASKEQIYDAVIDSIK